MSKTVAKTNHESDDAVQPLQTIETDSTRNGGDSIAHSGEIRYVDDKTFQECLEKVFTVHERLLAKLAE